MGSRYALSAIREFICSTFLFVRLLMRHLMQVFGPILHEIPSPSELNTSSKDWFDAVVKHTKTPEQLAAFQGSWVDVRDISLAHVKAIEVPEAGGNRFIISSGNFVWQDWCKYPSFVYALSH